MSITNINGIPFLWNEEEDKKLFGKLFPNGIESPNFKPRMPSINANAGSKLYKHASPFADFKWQRLKRDTNDVHKTFFPSARVQTANKVVIVKDPEVTFDLKEKDFIIYTYYERNGIKGYQSGDELVSTYDVRIFISTDGKKIEHAHFECEQPNDNEICFFIEDNTNDWSKAKLYALFGKNAKKELVSTLPETGVIKKYLLTIPGITPEMIQELIDKGVVEQPNGIIRSIVIGIADLFAAASLIAGGIGWFADTLGDAVLNYLAIPETIWNTDSDKYFLKKENLIESLTINNDTITKLEQALLPGKNVPALQDLSSVFIGEYTLKSTNATTTFIDKYNTYVTKQIEKLYQKLEEDNVEEDIRKSRIREMVAFLCGVWNGLVDFIGGTLKFIGMVFKIPYEVNFNLENVLETFDNFCFALHQVWDNIGDAFTDAFKKAKDYFKAQNGEDINSDKVAYAIGFGLAFIGTFFIPYTQLVKIANFSKIGKALLPAKYLEEISISSEKAINFVADKSRKALEIAEAAGKIIDDIIDLLRKGKQALSEFFETIWKKIVDWFRKNSKLVRVGENKLRAILNISYKLVKQTEEHVHKGIIRIQKIDPKLPKTDAKRIIEEYSYLPAKNAGQKPLKNFNYKAIVSGLHNQNNFIRGVVERVGKFIKIGKLPTGENVYKVAVKFYIKELGKWVEKTKSTTLFPKSWSEAKINQVILEASENIIFKEGRNIIGVAKNGTQIEMWISETTQEIETAWITFKKI